MINVYTTNSCPNCKVAKSYLYALGFEFNEILVDSEELINHVVKISGNRVIPVIEQGELVISGFNREEIKKLKR